MNTVLFNQKTPKGINKDIADRIRGIRRSLKISQTSLSSKSGVSLGSIKRFERTGDISLISLTKIAIALSCEDELTGLFTRRNFRSLQEVIDGQN